MTDYTQSNKFLNLYKDLGMAMKKVRKERKLTQKQVADKCNLSFDTYREYECASSKVPLYKLLIICYVLKVELRHILPIYNDIIIQEHIDTAKSGDWELRPNRKKWIPLKDRKKGK